MRTGHRITTNT